MELKTTPALGLAEKMMGCAVSLAEAERDNLKLLLGLAAGELAHGHAKPQGGQEEEAFTTVLACLARLQPHSNRVPPNGVVWRGRPPFLRDADVRALCDEAARVRSEAIEHNGHFLGCGGPLANALAVSPELVGFVTDKAGPVEPTAIASYLYYEEPGQGLPPHIDTEVFSLNALIMLRHVHDGAPRSCLALYPLEAPAEDLFLQSGEVCLFYADSVVHGRKPLGVGERVEILTIGFQPQLA